MGEPMRVSTTIAKPVSRPLAARGPSRCRRQGRQMMGVLSRAQLASVVSANETGSGVTVVRSQGITDPTNVGSGAMVRAAKLRHTHAGAVPSGLFLLLRRHAVAAVIKSSAT